jgi:hypothetical protein
MPLHIRDEKSPLAVSVPADRLQIVAYGFRRPENEIGRIITKIG